MSVELPEYGLDQLGGGVKRSSYQVCSENIERVEVTAPGRTSDYNFIM